MLAAIRPLPAAPLVPPHVSRVMRASTIATPPTLDRRGGPRRHDAEPIVDRFTAASHRPLPVLFAIGSSGHWALMVGLSISPHGILLRALDPRDAALELPQRDVLRAWRRLGARLGASGSPLWFSTTCIEARALVATLAEQAAHAEIAVELLPLDDRTPLAGMRLAGSLAPLADPAPHVLAVVLHDAHHRALEAAVTPAPRSLRGPAMGPQIGDPAVAAPAEPNPPGAPQSRGRRKTSSKRSSAGPRVAGPTSGTERRR